MDFDVEMENIGAFWRHSETQITKYNHQQNILRTKQKMLREDWEKFKTQRNDVKKQLHDKNSRSILEATAALSNGASSEG